MARLEVDSSKRLKLDSGIGYAKKLSLRCRHLFTEHTAGVTRDRATAAGYLPRHLLSAITAFAARPLDVSYRRGVGLQFRRVLTF